MEDRFIHYQESITSLNRAWRTVRELEAAEPGSAIWAAAYRMVLVEYCKPFKRSNGLVLKTLKLDVPELIGDLNQIHDQVLHLRDKFLAHSDLDSIDPKVYYAVNGEPIILKNTSPVMPSLYELRTLIENVLNHLYERESDYASYEKP